MIINFGEEEPNGMHWFGGYMGDDDLLYDQRKCMGVNSDGLSNVVFIQDYSLPERTFGKFYDVDHPSMQSPGPYKMTVAAAVVALDHYITSVHTTSFGKMSMVNNPAEREDFIDWFIDVCERTGMIQPTRPEFAS